MALLSGLGVPLGSGGPGECMVVMVGPLIGRKDGVGLWAAEGTPFVSFLTTGGGRVLTAVNPEGLFTAVKPLLTAMKPEEDTGLGWGVSAAGGVGCGCCICAGCSDTAGTEGLESVAGGTLGELVPRLGGADWAGGGGYVIEGC